MGKIEFESKGRGITEAMVTLMYQKRAEIWSLNPHDYSEWASREGLGDGCFKTKKELFIAWVCQNMPIGTLEERREAIPAEINTLREKLRNHRVRSSFAVFGSAARGVIKSPLSDLDIVSIVIPGEEELQQLTDLLEKNFVVSQTLSPLSDLAVLSSESQGLARIYSMTKGGVETEFHMLGQTTALGLHTLRPGYIKRVRPVQPKSERLSGFAGGNIYVEKPSDKIWNYHQQEGDFFRGFFPDVMLFSQVIHDPENVMFQVLKNIWVANVRAFLFHRGLIHSNGRYAVDRNAFTFEEFINTCIPADDQQFTPEFVLTMQGRFETALSYLNQRGLHITNLKT